MRILVVSDTHGNQSAVLRAYDAAGAIDTILHLGDGEAEGDLLAAVAACPVLQIAGNCDLGSAAPRELLCEWEQFRFLLCHGDRYGVKAGLAHLLKRGAETGADAILYGHTHLAQVIEQNGIWLINPGTMNRQAPFHSYAVLEINASGLQATIYPLQDQ